MDPSIQMNMFLSSGRYCWPGGVVPGYQDSGINEGIIVCPVMNNVGCAWSKSVNINEKLRAIGSRNVDSYTGGNTPQGMTGMTINSMKSVAYYVR